MNRKGVLSLVVMTGLFAGGLVLLQTNVAQAADPVTCDGYPEKRVYLENQSWVTPQGGDPAHPGFGQQGHIHVGTCFPLHQTITADVEFDIRVQLHNVSHSMLDMRVYAYQMGPPGVTIPAPIPSCPTEDCDVWVHVTFPIDSMQTSGWGNIFIYPQMSMGGTLWYNLNRWFVNIQNGKPPRPNPPTFGVPGTPQVWIGGDTWLPAPPGGGSNYSASSIDIADFPWNFQTGELIPISGTWQPDVKFGQYSNMWAQTVGKAIVDPALHAHPPTGQVVYQGVGGAKQLSINTTQLTNGVHRLLLSSCYTGRSDFTEHCGVLVVRFLVANGGAP